MLITKMFPQTLQSFLDMAELTDCSSHSTATVWKVSTGYYLKIDQPHALKQEYQLCDWFFRQGLGVEPILYLTKEKDYLLTQAADGQPAHHYLDRPKQLCQALAKILRQLHDRSVADCPDPNRLSNYLETAKTNADNGYFDNKYLLPRFAIGSREEALTLLTQQAHLLAADSLIHGDYCLPNVLFSADLEQATLIDVGTAGLADRHIDLFWCLWSLNYNLGNDDYGDYFLDCYGRELVDADKLRLIAAIECFG